MAPGRRRATAGPVAWAMGTTMAGRLANRGYRETGDTGCSARLSGSCAPKRSLGRTRNVVSLDEPETVRDIAARRLSGIASTARPTAVGKCQRRGGAPSSCGLAAGAAGVTGEFPVGAAAPGAPGGALPVGVPVVPAGGTSVSTTDVLWRVASCTCVVS